MNTKTLLLHALAVCLLAGACKKEKTEEPVPLLEGQARFTVLGQTYTQDSIQNTAMSNFSGDTLTFSSAWLSPNDMNNFELIVGISQFVPGGSLSADEIWALFEPGEKPFARLGGEPNGAVVQWRGLEGAIQGLYYSSAKGLQENSHFEITGRTRNADPTWPVFFATGTFSCTVYDGGLHVPKAISGEWNGTVPLF